MPTFLLLCYNCRRPKFDKLGSVIIILTIQLIRSKMSYAVLLLYLSLMTFEITAATELFSSVDAMSRLVQTEQHFINSLDQYLAESRRRLQELERYRHVIKVARHGFSQWPMHKLPPNVCAIMSRSLAKKDKTFNARNCASRQ